MRGSPSRAMIMAQTCTAEATMVEAIIAEALPFLEAIVRAYTVPQVA